MAEFDPNGIDPSEEKDDFQQIKGIGGSIAQALYQMGINHYTDLANLTPQELANRLRPKVAFITVQRIERDDWVGQAKALAKKKEKSAAARKDWQELADFFVSFGEKLGPQGEVRLQTKVHYSQADRFKEWDGIITQELIRWMVEQAHLPVPTEGEEPAGQMLKETPEDHPAGEAGDFQMILSNLWVSQVKMPALPEGQSLQRLVRVEANLDLAVEEGSLAPPDPVYFTAEIILVDLKTNGSIFFETPRKELFPQTLPYLLQHEIEVPPPGRYQLYLLIRLPTGKNAALQQGPILRVEG